MMREVEEVPGEGARSGADVRQSVGPDALFDIHDVAVVGASSGRHYSDSVIGNLGRAGLPDERIWRVNPRYEELDGHPCFPTLDSLPVTPSLVVSLTGTDRVEAVLQDVITTQVPALLVVADGYAEMGAEGSERQRRLAETASKAGVALLGPNSLGYASPRDGVAAWIGGRLPEGLRPGSLALVFQSSGMLNLVMAQLGRRRIGISGAVSVGNEAVLDTADFIRYYSADEATDVIGVVLESSSRPRALAHALAEAHAAGKRVVVLGIGNSDRGMMNVASHAGRLATSASVWHALFRQVGAIVVEDLDDLLETAALAAGSDAGNDAPGLALATISGGDCGLLCDMAEHLDVQLAEVTPATQSRLQDALSRSSILANPLDLRNTRTSDPEAFWTAIDALASDPHVGVVAFRLNLGVEPTSSLRELYARVAESTRSMGADCVFMSRVAEADTPGWFELFDQIGAPYLTSYGGALRAFAHLQDRSRTAALVAHDASFEGLNEELTSPVAAHAGGADEVEAWLADWDIPYTAHRFVSSSAEAAAAADDLGFPVALKGVVPGLAHKTEHGLVDVGLGDRVSVEASAERMLAVAASIGTPGTMLEVQAMVSGGQEFFIGAHTDPVLGRIISFGLGGIFLEVLRDVVYAIPPITSRQAQAMLSRLRGWPLLNGARGREMADVTALGDLIAAVSVAVARDPRLVALDLNPVMVLPAGSGVVAVDAYCEFARGQHRADTRVDRVGTGYVSTSESE
jgi:acetate---CoA ligase (ADP-forming)